MHSIDKLLKTVSHYHDLYRPTKTVACEPDPLFRTNQLEFMTLKFKEISAEKTLVRQLSPEQYKTLSEKLRDIKERSVSKARNDAGWIQSIVGFAFDVLSPTWNPISNAEAEMYDALQKIESAYKTELALKMPKILEKMQDKLHAAAAKSSTEFEAIVNTYVKVNHTLDTLVSTVEQILPILGPLKQNLVEISAELKSVVTDMTKAPPATQMEIRKKLQVITETVNSIHAATILNYNELNKEIEALFYLITIEKLSKRPFNPDQLSFQIQCTFSKLKKLLEITAPQAHNRLDAFTFLLNTSQLELFQTNLLTMEQNINLIRNPDDQFLTRHKFNSKATLAKTKMFLDELKENPLWKKAIGGETLDSPLSFNTEYWLLNRVTLHSMCEFKKFADVLEDYRSSLLDLQVAANTLSVDLEKPFRITQKQVRHDLAFRRNVRRPMKKPV